MRNRMYGGVRGRKMKVGGKLLHFPPTRLKSPSARNYSKFNSKFIKRRVTITFLILFNFVYNFDKFLREAHQFSGI